jgi:hypothetical protein
MASQRAQGPIQWVNHLVSGEQKKSRKEPWNLVHFLVDDLKREK